MRINDHVVRVGAPGPVRSLPRICVLSLLIVLAAPGARGQVGPWEAHTVSGGVVYAVEARPADLDGDGDVDVVSAALTGDKITVHENVGATGGSWTNHFVASVNGPSGLFPVDLDADGDLDVVSSAAFADTVAWHENLNGQGTLWTQRVISSNTQSVRDVFAVDIDGDGDIDVYSASNRDNKIAWHENTAGDGTLWVEGLVAILGGAWSVYGGDIDGDGDVDAAVAAKHDVAWYENDLGAGSTWSQTVVFTSLEYGRSVAAADLDGDNDLDIISGGLDMEELSWHDNLLGDGTSWVTHALPALESGNWITVAELDNDGDLDLVTASSADDRIDWHENTVGDASAWDKQNVYDGTAGGAVFADVADIDGDGDWDVTSANHNQNLVRWHENEFPLKSLVADVSGLSLATGGSQSYTFFADPPPQIHFYILLGSLAGPVPGILVDGLLLPLTPDAYFLHTLQNPNGPELTNSVGTLQPDGTNPAPVSFNLPAGLDPLLLGVNVYHAYAVVDLFSSPGQPFVSFVSNWVRVTLDP